MREYFPAKELYSTVMKFAHIFSAILVVAAVTVVQPQITMALTPVEVKAMSKEFTVRVNGGGNGTGVIFSRKGNTYFVLTNRHVISTDDRYEVQTPDGNSYPIYHSQELPGLDLAVLQFTSNKNYRTANFTNSDQIKEKMTVYVAGWSADPLPDINERSYEFTIGSILRREQKPDQGYALVYDNEAIPGTSGGPVLDENGRVVGINGRAIKDWRTGNVVRLGIPINFFVIAENNPQKLETQTTAIASPQPTAEDYINLGGAKVEEGNYQGAIADYTQAVELNPDSPDAYFRRGVAYNQLQNYQAALNDFNQVVQISPKNVFAYGYRSVVYLKLKDYHNAITDSNQILRIDPNSASSVIAYSVRGAAYKGLGQNQKAFADIQKSKEQANRLQFPKTTPTFNQSITRNGNDRKSRLEPSKRSRSDQGFSQSNSPQPHTQDRVNFTKPVPSVNREEGAANRFHPTNSPQPHTQDRVNFTKPLHFPGSKGEKETANNKNN